MCTFFGLASLLGAIIATRPRCHVSAVHLCSVVGTAHVFLSHSPRLTGTWAVSSSWLLQIKPL